MTAKQIAAYLGRPERTAQDWVKALGAKSASIGAKLASSSPMKPADYDLAETCLIIEEGMGKDVADVYRTNAVHAELGLRAKRTYSAAFLREYRITYGIEAAKGLLAELGFAPKPPASQATNLIAFEGKQWPDSTGLGDKADRQIRGAINRIIKDAINRAEADKKQGRLL